MNKKSKTCNMVWLYLPPVSPETPLQPIVHPVADCVALAEHLDELL